ncbi:MAG TPA: histidine phosphatase family protein [Pyrinomonadaceae bacterium]|nr:histidine phosphatase family protein [Pyrinomonadaceae bacterium]
MRILYLLRHAKSSWNDPTLRDFDRPLKKRGREAAERIGERMASENLHNPLVICSPAVRTRETAEIVLTSANMQIEPRFDERIYEASLGELVQIVREIPDDTEVAIMIGHNPGFEEVLSFLTGEHRRMPTCALAKIGFGDVSWKDVRAGEGSLEWFIAPKELPED